VFKAAVATLKNLRTSRLLRCKRSTNCTIGVQPLQSLKSARADETSLPIARPAGTKGSSSQNGYRQNSQQSSSTAGNNLSGLSWGSEPAVPSASGEETGVGGALGLLVASGLALGASRSALAFAFGRTLGLGRKRGAKSGLGTSGASLAACLALRALVVPLGLFFLAMRNRRKAETDLSECLEKLLAMPSGACYA